MISSISTCGITLKFQKYSVPVSKSGKCCYCGRRAVRSSTFEMHRSLFNCNPDGSEMSESDIMVKLGEKALSWKGSMEVYHDGCRKKHVVDALRGSGFVCTVESDRINVWITPTWHLSVNYDSMRAYSNSVGKTSTLGELVDALVSYRNGYNYSIGIDRKSVKLDTVVSGKSGKVFTRTRFSSGTCDGNVVCELHGIGESEDESFENCLKVLVSLGEKAREYLDGK